MPSAKIVGETKYAGRVAIAITKVTVATMAVTTADIRGGAVAADAKILAD